ncbi:MAG: glycoside hydrolase family 130 protein [Halobacteriota archaeon]
MIRNEVMFKERTVFVDLHHPVARFQDNPVITADDVNQVWQDPGLQVVTVHNAGIAQHNGETVMLFRSHLRCGKSVLGVARSRNGIDNWRVELEPAMAPATEEDDFAPGTDAHALIENEAGGVEDPRITQIGDTYYITYSAYHATIKNRVRTSLATTRNFSHFVRCGPVFEQDMRNVVIFPERIGDRYVGLFRPNDVTDGEVGGRYTQIKLGWTSSIESNRWEIQPEPIMRTGGGPSAFSDKIGPGAPPLSTAKGWLSVFHGVRTTMAGNPYVLGVALHDLTDPARIQLSSIPILFPSKADCRVPEGAYVHVPQVVFTCGAQSQDDGSILIYYGGNDTVMNVGVTHEDVLIALCERYSQDPLTGQLKYDIPHSRS